MNDVYKCLKCGRVHKKGKIYDDHIMYDNNRVPYNRVYKINPSQYNKLTNIAKRQILRYFNKIKQNFHRRGVYYYQINKILIHDLGINIMKK